MGPYYPLSENQGRRRPCRTGAPVPGTRLSLRGICPPLSVRRLRGCKRRKSSRTKPHGIPLRQRALHHHDRRLRHPQGRRHRKQLCLWHVLRYTAHLRRRLREPHQKRTGIFASRSFQTS